MKLLVCTACFDVFRLSEDERSCECGRTSGRYVGCRNAEVNGTGISLAIGNGSLQAAMDYLAGDAGELDRRGYIDGAGFRVICWVRPHEGPGNPHTKVVKK